MSDEFDEFDNFDSGGDDFADFDLSMDGMDPDAKGSRDPVSDFKGSVLSEFNSASKIVETARQAGVKALPRGYTTAINEVGDIKDELESIADKAWEDLNPAKENAKRIGRLALPKAKKLLPKGLYDKLEGKLERGEGSTGEVDQDKLAMASAMTSIFGVQQEQQEKQTVADGENRKVEEKRFNASLDVSKVMADGVNKLVGYQDNILIKYQQKSLELQHLHYFSSRDLYAYTKALGAESTEMLRAIVKNSALPNERKIELDEVYSQNMKEAIGGMVAAPLADKLRNVPKNIFKRISSKAGEVTGRVNDQASQIADMLEQIGGDDGPQMSAGEIAGMMAGGAVRGWTIEKLSKFMKSRTDKLDDTHWFNQGNAKATGIFQNLGTWINTKRKDENSRAGRLLNLLSDDVTGDDESIVHNLASNAGNVATWGQLERRTLIEIIPGYLSRQLQQLTNIATGKQNAREVYSVEREDFVTTDQADRDLQKQFFGTVNGSLKTSSDGILELIDPDGKLSPDARLSFIKRMSIDTVKGELFDFANYTKPHIFQSHGKEIARMVVEFLGVDDVEQVRSSKVLNKQNKINSHYESMRDSTQGLDELISRYAITGKKEALRSLGLIRKDGNVNDTMDYKRKWDLIHQLIDSNFELDSNGLPVKGVKGTLNRNTTTGSVNASLNRVSETTATDPRLEEVLNNLSGGSAVGVDNGFKAALLAPMEALSSIFQTHAETNKDLLERILGSLTEGMRVRIDEEGESAITANLNREGIMPRILHGAMDGLKFGFRTGGKVLGGMGSFGGKTFKGITGSLKGMREGMRGYLTRTKKYIGDIQIKGTNTVLLRKVLMEQGEYIDVETGKVINSLGDITGEVRDTAGNIIISKADFARGLITSSFESATGLFGRVKDGISGAVGAQFDRLRNLKKAAGRGLSSLYDTVVQPMDVYVAGEESPRLLKIIFNNRGYFSVKTGMPLKNHDDIDGPVKDVEGQVVLSTEDIGKGLFVMRDGKLVTLPKLGLITRMMNAGGYLLGKAKAFGQGLLSIGNGILQMGKTAVTGILSGMVSKLDELMFAEKHTMVDLLGGIYDHIRLAFPVVGQSELDSSDVITNAETRKAGSGNTKARFDKTIDSAKDKVESLKEAAKAGIKEAEVKAESLKESASDLKDVAKDKAKEAKDKIRDAKKRFEKEFGEKYDSSATAEELLQQVSAKLSKVTDDAKDKVLGDLDGDGLRDGGWRAKLKGSKINPKNWTRGQKAGAAAVGGIGGLAKLKGLFKRKAKPGSDKIDDALDETNESGIADKVLDIGETLGLSALWGKYRKKGSEDEVDNMLDENGRKGTKTKSEMRKRQGKMAKLWNLAKKAGNVATLGIGSGIASGAAGGSGVLGTIGGAVWGGVKGLAKSPFRLIGYGARAAGFLATNPIGWGVMAAAAAAYVGYKFYKWASKRTALEPIEKLRFLQYGINVDSRNQYVAIRTLEDYMKKRLHATGNDPSNIQLKMDVDFVDIWNNVCSAFDCEQSSPQHAAAFRTWFFDRFVKVFSLHKYAVQKLAPGVDLLDIDDEMDEAIKGPFAHAVTITREVVNAHGVDPLMVTTSPFPNDGLSDNALLIKTLTERIIDASKAGIEVDLKNSSDLLKAGDARKNAMKARGAYNVVSAIDTRKREILDMLKRADLTKEERAMFRRMTAEDQYKYLTEEKGLAAKTESQKFVETTNRYLEKNGSVDGYMSRAIADFGNSKRSDADLDSGLAYLQKSRAKYSSMTKDEFKSLMDNVDWQKMRKSNGKYKPQFSAATKKYFKEAVTKHNSTFNKEVNEMLLKHKDLLVPFGIPRGATLSLDEYHVLEIKSITESPVFAIHEGEIIKIKDDVLDPDNNSKFVQVAYSNGFTSTYHYVFPSDKLKLGLVMKGDIIGRTNYVKSKGSYMSSHTYFDTKFIEQDIREYMSKKNAKLLTSAITTFVKDGEIIPRSAKEVGINNVEKMAESFLPKFMNDGKPSDILKRSKPKEEKSEVVAETSPINVNVDQDLSKMESIVNDLSLTSQKNQKAQTMAIVDALKVVATQQGNSPTVVTQMQNQLDDIKQSLDDQMPIVESKT